MSHREKILTALKAGDTLTPMDALRRFGCFRLAARVNELRDEGLQIQSRIEKTEEGRRYARYWLA